MKPISKEEKIILIFTLVFSILLVGGGLFYRSKVKDEVYTSLIPDVSETLKEIKVKENIKLEVKEEMIQDVSYYLEGDEEQLSLIRLDVSGVDNQKLGKYQIQGTYRGQKFKIPVEVVDTKAPVITVEHNNFTFYIENGDTIEDVRNHANVKVSDNYDEGLTVGEWITEFPTTDGTVIYTLKVTDSSGNEATFDLIVNYIMRLQIDVPPDPEQPETPNQPEEPEPENPGE